MIRRKNLTWMLPTVLLISIAISVALTGLGTGNPEVVLYVDPPEVLDVDIGNSFDINITASDVEDLFLTEIYLSWDPPLLYTDTDSINTGDVAPYLEFMMIEEVNNDEGWLHVVVGRPIGTKVGLSGTVQIAKITFLVEAEGSCDLHFYDTRLKNSATPSVDIEHTVEDGYFSNLPPVVQYTLTITVVGSGTTSPAPNGHVYDAGVEVEVDALPADGWMLDHWLLDAQDVGSTDPITVLMNDDRTLTAVFVEIPVVQYTLTITVVGSGTTSPAPNGHVYDAGVEVEVDALPADGWMLDHWLLDAQDVGSTDPITVLMNDDRTLTAVFVEIIGPPVATIESCDSTGTKEDTFKPSESMYVMGSGYSSEETFDIFVVEDVAVWSDGMPIPTRVPDTELEVTSDTIGDIPPTEVWSSPLIPGKYDIVVDFNGNGVYDEGIDALDDNDIEVTAGFFVIPEYAFGTILGLVAFFAAFGVFLRSKRTK